MNDQPTVRWLRDQAYTVLADLMCSDDDRIALRAAHIVITSLRQEATREEEANKKEKQLVLRWDEDDSPAGRSSWAAPNPEQHGPLPGSGLRASVGKDRDREDRST